MAESLRSRLARARELVRSVRLDVSSGVEPPGDGASERESPAGWSEIAPFVLFRRLERPNLLPRSLDPRPFLGRTAAREGGADLPAERLLFFDLETTGLSGGAGTIAFLAAFGRAVPGAEGGHLEIRQYFLSDYPGEGDFLDAVLAEPTPGDVLASYNGRAFDEPLIRSRCVLNKRTWPALPHADFLPAARRLWRNRFPDCSLGTLESMLLGRSRTLDVPGARIPEIWLEYLRKGFQPLLEAVLAHNSEDIESLAALAAECIRMYGSPDLARDCDLTALGAFWFARDPERAERTLVRAFREGSEKAGYLLLKLYRRRGDWKDYERILDELSPSWAVWVERAKHEEHRNKDYELALAMTRKAEEFAASAELRKPLEKRGNRLARKLEAILRPEGRTSRRRS